MRYDNMIQIPVGDIPYTGPAIRSLIGAPGNLLHNGTGTTPDPNKPGHTLVNICSVIAELDNTAKSNCRFACVHVGDPLPDWVDDNTATLGWISFNGKTYVVKSNCIG